MKGTDHGGSVQAIEGNKAQAKCRCGWQSIENSVSAATLELDRHITKHMTDEGGRKL